MDVEEGRPGLGWCARRLGRHRRRALRPAARARPGAGWSCPVRAARAARTGTTTTGRPVASPTACADATACATVGVVNRSDSACTSLEILGDYFDAVGADDYETANAIIHGPDCPHVTQGTQVTGPLETADGPLG